MTLLFSALFYSLTATATPKIDITYDFYKIYPSELASIGGELNLKSKTEAEGKRYRAHAVWNVELNYKWEKTDSSCKVSSVDTTAHIRYTMPQLFSDSVGKEIKTTFNKYYKALLLHEEGHKENGVQAAKELSLFIRNLPSMSNCELLHKRINEKSNDIVEKYHKLDNEYDKLTTHGRSQGVHLI